MINAIWSLAEIENLKSRFVRINQNRFIMTSNHHHLQQSLYVLKIVEVELQEGKFRFHSGEYPFRHLLT